jgi:hypothetical protein
MTARLTRGFILQKRGLCHGVALKGTHHVIKLDPLRAWFDFYGLRFGGQLRRPDSSRSTMARCSTFHRHCDNTDEATALLLDIGRASTELDSTSCLITLRPFNTGTVQICHLIDKETPEPVVSNPSKLAPSH